MSDSKALLSRSDLLKRLSELEAVESQINYIKSYELILQNANHEIVLMEKEIEKRSKANTFLINQINICESHIEDLKNANERLNLVIESQNSLIEYYFSIEEERLDEDVRDLKDIKEGYSVLYDDFRGYPDV